MSSVVGSVRFEKRKKHLLKKMRQAIDDYGLFTESKKVMVCVSGGKDSYTLIDLLIELKWRGLVNFDLFAMTLDQSQPGYPADVMPQYFRERDIPFHVEKRDTYAVVTKTLMPGQTMCSLCSRLRRGNLYRVAREQGADTLALGHHLDDALETLLLNLFHGGKLAAMPPKLVNDEGDLVLVRPLCLAREHDIEAYATARAFPIIPCTLCGSQPGLQRQNIKEMIQGWDRDFPGRAESMGRALSQVSPSHLMDSELFNFAELRARPKLQDEDFPISNNLMTAES